MNFINVFCGSNLALEGFISLKLYFNSFGCSNILYLQSYLNNFDIRFYFQLNDTFVNLEHKILVLFFGLNMRLESPLLNLRLRKSFLGNIDFKAYSIGLGLNYLTYPVLNLGILY